MEGKELNAFFDVTLDTPNYWDHFWENNDGIGGGSADPDSSSETLRRYHALLWSKRLPNGEFLQLAAGKGAAYLTWKNFRFGSDSIIASFRYKRYQGMLEQLEKLMPDYRDFVEDFLRQTYTIGGSILFPKHVGSINQARGCNRQIQDRWDLTLECIRRFYLGEKSPLYDTLSMDGDFFALFGDFNGYVDFFRLQDCIDPLTNSIAFWLGEGDLDRDPLPQTVEEYLLWLNRERAFVHRRNMRLQADFDSLSLSPVEYASK